jgi:hypothetical protein
VLPIVNIHVPPAHSHAATIESGLCGLEVLMNILHMPQFGLRYFQVHGVWPFAASLEDPLAIEASASAGHAPIKARGSTLQHEEQ